MPHSCMQVSEGYTFCTCTIRCHNSTSSPGYLKFPLWSDSTLLRTVPKCLQIVANVWKRRKATKSTIMRQNLISWIKHQVRLTNEMSIKQWLLTCKAISHFHLKLTTGISFPEYISPSPCKFIMLYTEWTHYSFGIKLLLYKEMHCSRVHTIMRFVLKEIKSVGFLVLHIVTESHKINVAAVERVVQISSTAYRILKAQTCYFCLSISVI